MVLQERREMAKVQRSIGEERTKQNIPQRCESDGGTMGRPRQFWRNYVLTFPPKPVIL